MDGGDEIGVALESQGVYVCVSTSSIVMVRVPVSASVFVDMLMKVKTLAVLLSGAFTFRVVRRVVGPSCHALPGCCSPRLRIAPITA